MCYNKKYKELVISILFHALKSRKPNLGVLSMMICPNCGEQYKDGTMNCQRCGAPLMQQYTQQSQFQQPNPMFYQQQPKKKSSAIPIVIVAVIAAFVGLQSLGNHGKQEKAQTSSNSYSKDSSVSAKTESKEKKQDSDSNVNASSKSNEVSKTDEKKSITDCYESVEHATYTNSIGRTILIDKVLAKEDVAVTSTIILKDAEDNVIGKSEDTIHLVKGEYNYFRFQFDKELTDDTKMEQKTKQASDWSVGTNDAVELVKYNQEDYHLYLTFRQIKDTVGSFSRFKLLFYKNGEIIHDEDGYFSVYAENLDGKDSEDVASLSIFDIDYDDIEYIFEP